ncbi:MATE family efflux transporter [Actinocrispum wychmicini]|uniref:Putative MATE family efflux protein n=1 Tax=Actinocrispum wychmicini TaxID=1213861 RepID=A0A4R2JB94_9PSEU|nr:MATE family efflux transporter [Actinocrispum wychmicini]TCO56751.1 putative MATE family efflux protein [Actinocrispum wychmicini]
MTPLRRLLSLAVPALVVLAAEPLYLLVDTAVVGHLGAVPLAGLSVAVVLMSQVSNLLTFLSYGTTATAARLYGAGRRTEAVAEGVQATWLAVVVGMALVVVGQVAARPVADLLAGSSEVADATVGWLRIGLFGWPLVLITMAGNGWMRGVQDTARPLRYVLAGNGISALLCPILVHVVGWGLTGSAIANVVAQVISAAMFIRALMAEQVSLRPSPSKMRAQLSMGRDLLLRGIAFQASHISATTVAAHMSTATVGAHQIVLQLWNFLGLVLDSLAIAAQSLVGESLGASDERHARSVAWQVAGYGLIFGSALGVVFALLAGVLPHAFTTDPAVLAEVPHAWWFFVALQPICGVVFALDGVLVGAGDAAFMRNSTLLAAFAGFLPLIWAAYLFGWGLVGIWAGLSAFLVVRLVAVVSRTRSGRWAVVGAVR